MKYSRTNGMFARHCSELFMKHVLPKFSNPTLWLAFEKSWRFGWWTRLGDSSVLLHPHVPSSRCSSNRINWFAITRHSSKVSSSFVRFRIRTLSQSRPSLAHKQNFSCLRVAVLDISHETTRSRSFNLQALNVNSCTSTCASPLIIRTALRTTFGPPPYQPCNKSHISREIISKST